MMEPLQSSASFAGIAIVQATGISSVGKASTWAQHNKSGAIYDSNQFVFKTHLR